MIISSLYTCASLFLCLFPLPWPVALMFPRLACFNIFLVVPFAFLLPSPRIQHCCLINIPKVSLSWCQCVRLLELKAQCFTLITLHSRRLLEAIVFSLSLRCGLCGFTISFFPFFKKNYWSIGELQGCVSFRYIAKWISHTCMYIYPFFFRFFSHIGYHRVLNRFPPAM